MRVVNDQDGKPKKLRRRRATGRVSGTSQSAFATNSMSSILQQQAEKEARKNAKPEDEAADQDADDAADGKTDEDAQT